MIPYYRCGHCLFPEDCEYCIAASECECSTCAHLDECNEDAILARSEYGWCEGWEYHGRKSS